MTNEQQGKVVLSILIDDEENLYTNLDCSIPQLYNVVINLVGVLEENTGLEYNSILEDLKEIKK